MALKDFCSKCGCATEYTLVKPVFCSSCGAKLNESASSAKQPSIPSNNKPFVSVPTRIIGEPQPEYGEDEDGRYKIVNTVPKIDKLQVDIDIRGSTKNRVTLGDLRPDIKKTMSDKRPAKRSRKQK